MKQQHIDYQFVPFPKAQQTIAAALLSTEHKHTIHVLYDATPREDGEE